VNGQTLATLTFFEGSGYSGSPCVFTASGMLQTNAT